MFSFIFNMRQANSQCTWTERVQREHWREQKSRKREYGEEERYWIPDKVVITHSWNAIVRLLPLVTTKDARARNTPLLYISLSLSLVLFSLSLSLSVGLKREGESERVIAFYTRSLLSSARRHVEKGRHAWLYETGTHLYDKARSKLIHFFRSIFLPVP